MGSSFLDRLSTAAGAALTEAMTTETFEAGTKLIDTDQPGKAMFILDAGIVRVSLEDELGSSHVTDLGPGDVVGEMALVTKGLTLAQVTAVQKVTCRRLTREAFAKVAFEYPEVRNHLETIADERSQALRHALTGELDAPKDPF